jgi:hypothetical protein
MQIQLDTAITIKSVGRLVAFVAPASTKFARFGGEDHHPAFDTGTIADPPGLCLLPEPVV